MKFDIRTPVRYPDGEQVGIIEKVVFDPQTLYVSHIVVVTPLFIARSVLVPIIFFRADPGDVITFAGDRDALDGLPDYEVEQVMEPPEGWEPPENYVPGDGIFTETVHFPIVPVFEQSNAPKGSVEWSQGTEILCTDGRFGTVDVVLTSEDAAGSRIVGLVVRADGDISDRLLIPPELITAPGSQSIEISCTLDGLPQQAQPYSDDGEPEAEPLAPAT